MTILTYKCPNCLSEIKYESKKEKWFCSECGHSFSKEEIKKNISDEGDKINKKIDFNDIKKYKCNNCNIDFITSKQETFTIIPKCAYCDNVLEEIKSIENDKTTNPFKENNKIADFIIPFEINRKKAKEIYLNHIKQVICRENKISEEIVLKRFSPIYIPYALIDARINYNIKGTGKKETEKINVDTNYLITDIYSIDKNSSLKVKKILIGTSKISNKEKLKYIQNFDFSKIKNTTEESFEDIPSELSDFEINEKISKKLKKTISELTKKEITYKDFKIEEEKFNIKEISQKNILLPFWILNFKFDGQKYTFIINGQTGDIIGDVPFSKNNLLKISGIIFGISYFSSLILFNIINLF